MRKLFQPFARLVAIVAFLAVDSFSLAATSEERDLSQAFGSYSGAFVLYDAARDHWVRHNPAECRVRKSPCSTFKILNSLIALETGVANGPNFGLKWDGKERSIKAWNRDHTLRTAFAESCVWFYQELASRIGAERMQKFVTDVGYGDADTSGGITQFWLESSLTISPEEQVDFLRRLQTRKLPFNAKSIDTLLDIMTLSQNGKATFLGKTGTGSEPGKDVATMGWFVGIVSAPAGEYCFATRIAGGENPTGRNARKITESILASLKILPYSVYDGWPFDAAEAVRRQEETAKTLETPVNLQTPSAKDGPQITWRLIPAGKYMMGSPQTEDGHEGDERLHEETISEPFYMMETQLTVEQYRALMKSEPSDAGDGSSPKIPAGILYRDTVDKVLPAMAKLAPAGWKVILPDHPRLEYAARAGIATMNPGGDKREDAAPFAWSRENSGRKVQPVAQKRANAWGLHDVIGNRWHWFWRAGRGYGNDSTDDHIVYGGSYNSESGGNGVRLGNIMISRGPEGARFALVRAESPLPKGHPDPQKAAAISHGIKAGEEREVTGIKFCWCPPGKFTMGSPADETDRRADEAQVEVTLTKGFWMGKYEVTQAQWKRLAGEIRGQLIAGEGDDFPVYWVSFVAAEEFCRKLTALARESGELPAGWVFQIPTEAQWEYACRAGTTTAFSFGNGLTPQQATIGKPYDGKPDGTPGSAASVVGTHPPNAWGIHDMHGNEFELCRDWYHANLPGGVDPDLSERKGEMNRDGTYSRVRRGGAWNDGPKFCRSAVRFRYEPDRNSDHIGFRVILAPL